MVLKKDGKIDEEMESLEMVGNIKNYQHEQDEIKKQISEMTKDLSDGESDDSDDLFTKKKITVPDKEQYVVFFLHTPFLHVQSQKLCRLKLPKKNMQKRHSGCILISSFRKPECATIAAVNEKENFIFDYLLKQKWNDQEGSDVDYSSGEDLADRKYHKGFNLFLFRYMILFFEK